jgi:uncharacterized membrane protein YdjX (TVP38/TMEM64 family)
MGGEPMTEALSHFINDAGWLAPLYYVLSFVVTALLPVIPTPLVGALGGAAFGTVPAILYGIVGLGLGAIVALGFSRLVGRPVVLRLVTPKAWSDWEALLGIRSAAVWGIIFFVLNVDFAYLAAGLSGIPLRRLWLAAMIARFPWLVASAFFGDLIFVSDTVMVLALVVMVAMLVVFSKLRPRVQHLLVHWALRFAPPSRLARTPPATATVEGSNRPATAADDTSPPPRSAADDTSPPPRSAAGDEVTTPRRSRRPKPSRGGA